MSDMHNQHNGKNNTMQVKSKIWFEKNGKLIFGEGKSEMLKAIDAHRSINQAAKSMGISFRQAWSHISEIEKRLGIKLIERSKGGLGGGGSELTGYAKELIRRYDRLKKEIDEYTDKKVRDIFSGWKNMK